jgi:hypothetical protein
MHGSPYPTSSSLTQSLNVTVRCASSASDPKFLSYENDTAYIEWSVPGGCASASTPDKGDDKPVDGAPRAKHGSGMGLFFLACVLAA